MFKVKNIIFSINTENSLKKITSSTDFKDMKLSFSLSKLRSEYEKAKEVIELERKKIIERFCLKEGNKPKLTEQGQYIFDAENGLKVQEEIKKLYETTESEFNMDKIIIKLDQIPIIEDKTSSEKYKEKSLLSADDLYYLNNLINFEE